MEMCGFSGGQFSVASLSIFFLKRMCNREVGTPIMLLRENAILSFSTAVRQALQFTSDFKLGHYMKIPHRPMF
jgi:hypothetical protein